MNGESGTGVEMRAAVPVLGEQNVRRHIPSLPLLRLLFLLTGLGTAMLGPILPLVARQWHLRDEQTGLLLMAQFCGAFIGGASMSWRLRRGLLLGLAAATVGVGCFAAAPGLALACAGLLLGGFGIGHSITAINILAGLRFTERRASTLALLNFFWSFGAMLSPLLAAALTPRFRLGSILGGLAVLFGVCGLAFAAQVRSGERDTPPQNARNHSVSGLTARSMTVFLAMLFLYGGLETCLSGWLTTYSLRYGRHGLVVSEYTTLLFWMSLTLGRAASSALLLAVREKLVWRLALLAAMLLTFALALSQTAAAIAITTVLLGLSVAPWFPITFALLMAEQPRPQQAGLVISVSGLGAASLPWLMGVISTRGGGLQMALITPVLAGAGLLALSFAVRTRPATGETLA